MAEIMMMMGGGKCLVDTYYLIVPRNILMKSPTKHLKWYCGRWKRGHIKTICCYVF